MVDAFKKTHLTLAREAYRRGEKKYCVAERCVFFANWIEVTQGVGPSTNGTSGSQTNSTSSQQGDLTDEESEDSWENLANTTIDTIATTPEGDQTGQTDSQGTMWQSNRMDHWDKICASNRPLCQQLSLKYSMPSRESLGEDEATEPPTWADVNKKIFLPWTQRIKEEDLMEDKQKGLFNQRSLNKLAATTIVSDKSALKMLIKLSLEQLALTRDIQLTETNEQPWDLALMAVTAGIAFTVAVKSLYTLYKSLTRQARQSEGRRDRRFIQNMNAHRLENMQ